MADDETGDPEIATVDERERFAILPPVMDDSVAQRLVAVTFALSQWPDLDERGKELADMAIRRAIESITIPKGNHLRPVEK